MDKQKILIYSRKPAACRCFKTIFNHQFDTAITNNPDKFFQEIKEDEIDAAVFCSGSAHEKDVNEFIKRNAVKGLKPLLICAERLSPVLIGQSVQQGDHYFINCRMDEEQIRNIVYEAINKGELRKYLETFYTGDYSPHIKRMIQEIFHTFPERIPEGEMAQRLGISRNWIQKLCHNFFNISYTRLIQRLWIYQALCLMHRTTLDNTEIAFYLNYSEESSMARNFRNELGFSPTKARKLLMSKSPIDIMKP